MKLTLASSELTCPSCGATEMHPTEDQLLIRGYKYSDKRGHWSQCLVCAGYYNNIKELKETPENFAKDKGWFV